MMISICKFKLKILFFFIFLTFINFINSDCFINRLVDPKKYNQPIRYGNYPNHGGGVEVYFTVGSDGHDITWSVKNVSEFYVEKVLLYGKVYHMRSKKRDTGADKSVSLKIGQSYEFNTQTFPTEKLKDVYVNVDVKFSN